MNKGVNGNIKLFWKEMSNTKGAKVECCNKTKDVNRKLTQGGNEVRGIWKAYFEDLFNIDTQEQVAVSMHSFDEVLRSNYFGGESVGRA